MIDAIRRTLGLHQWQRTNNPYRRICKKCGAVDEVIYDGRGSSWVRVNYNGNCSEVSLKRNIKRKNLGLDQ
jgi:hypothetical protein